MTVVFQSGLSFIWRWPVFRLIKYQRNRWNWVTNQKTHKRRSSLNYPRTCRKCYNCLWPLPSKLDGKFEHAAHCCKICSKTCGKRFYVIATWLLFRITLFTGSSSLLFWIIAENWKWNWKDGVLQLCLSLNKNRTNSCR